LFSPGIDKDLIAAYYLIHYGLSECFKTTKYNNPQLYLSFNSDNSLCGLIFFYETTINDEKYNWVESWADYISGAGSLVMFYTVNRTGQLGYSIGGNIVQANDETVSVLEEQNSFVFKDPSTKWILIPNQTLLDLGKSQAPHVAEIKHFSKIYPSFPTTDNPIRYDFNSNNWIDTVINPLSDYGTAPEYEIDKFYKFDTLTKTWILD